MNQTLNATIGTNMSSSANETQDTETILIFTFLLLLGALTIALNAFVVYLTCTRRSLRTSTNYFLISLACSDLLAGLITIPLITTCNLTDNDYVCVAMDLFNRFLCLSTILHLSSIALERYVYIVHLMTTETFSNKALFSTLVSIWIFSPSVTLIQFAFIDVNEVYGTKKGMEHAEMVYNLCFVLILVFLPLLVIIYAYVRIYLVLKRQNENIARQEVIIQEDKIKKRRLQLRREKEKRAVFVFMGMVVNYSFGWFHYFLDGLRQDIITANVGWYETPYWLTVFFMFTRYGTSLINPLLYTFLKQDFKQALEPFKNRFRSSGTGGSSLGSSLASDQELNGPLLLEVHGQEFTNKVSHGSNTADSTT